MTRLAPDTGADRVPDRNHRHRAPFVDKEIIPAAQELEHSDTYPQAIVDQMREMGLFGLMVLEEYGGLWRSRC